MVVCVVFNYGTGWQGIVFIVLIVFLFSRVGGHDKARPYCADGI